MQAGTYQWLSGLQQPAHPVSDVVTKASVWSGPSLNFECKGTDYLFLVLRTDKSRIYNAVCSFTAKLDTDDAIMRVQLSISGGHGTKTSTPILTQTAPGIQTIQTRIENFVFEPHTDYTLYLNASVDNGEAISSSLKLI